MLLTSFSNSAGASETMRMCHAGERNGPEKHCLVDGDTIWIHGSNIRLKGFDTPEPATEICGGEAEVELAYLASNRLLELLNSKSWTVETFGIDGTGKRLLGTIRIDGRDVGDILISEGLARSWPDGDEWWCP
ncbi:thermonuclease family protein [Devosia limi]|nr:thermonuclease family protein [Devosia limi]